MHLGSRTLYACHYERSFPYIILGALFGKSAGGRTLIKLAFRWTRNLRGGPAPLLLSALQCLGQ